MRSIEHIAILIAALGLLLGTAGCPSDDDDSAGDDDAADDDAADDDAGDDDGAGTDADGDGFTDDVDCDDGDPDVNPDATEFCYDDVDNNCDGDVDEADADDCAVNDAEIVVEGDGATVTIPEGAVMGDLAFDVAVTTPPRLPGHCTPVTDYFLMTPVLVTLLEAGLIELPEAIPGGARQLTLFFWSSKWVEVSTDVTYVAGHYEAPFTETGIYIIADCVLAP